MLTRPGATPALRTIGVLVMTPRFTPNPLANHTHLASYTRTVSLHRAWSRSAD